MQVTGCLADKQTALTIAVLTTTNRKKLRRTIERTSLANETLPTLVALDISVDLRLKFEKNKITDAVPVAILHIDTDVRPEIWLQLTQGQLRRITERFNELLQQMDVVEALYEEKIASEK